MASEDKPASNLYESTLQQLHHYDLSVGLRLIWLNNSQAFMFGVYSALTVIRSPTPFLHNKAAMLSTIIPVIGVLISFFTLMDIISGLVRMKALVNNYKDVNDAEQEENFPLLDGTVADRLFQRVSPVCIALVFLAVWAYLILYDHRVL